MSTQATKRHVRIDVDDLKRQRPLADAIASSGVALRREGPGTFRGLCPFHQERTPSFWVDARDADNEHYYCFGCLATGDVITFVMTREECSFVEACERLAGRCGPPVLQPVERIPTARSGRRWELMDPESPEGNVVQLATQVYEDQLWRSRRAQDYLRSRAVPEEVARTQRLGYADGRTLLHHLEGAGHDRHSGRPYVDVAQDLGLVLSRPPEWGAGPPYREFLTDRLIIPELRGGHPIWFIGRALEDDGPNGAPAPLPSTMPPEAKPKKRPRPKYLSLAGERPILGLDRVAGHAVAYVVEGPFDWLAAVHWGLPAFAICGTHFPIDRLPALSAAVAIYGVFDPDRAGQSAAERFAPQIGTRWRPIRLPNGLDLAELAALGETGRETFHILVGRARAAAWQSLAG